MVGLYVHIPFCRKLCSYCDFYFSVSLQNKEEMVNAICLELELQKDYLQGESVGTIYFGGGTPSLLNETELGRIFQAIEKNYPVSSSAEITLEANPDDITPTYAQLLRKLGINRLSLGLQSFIDEQLVFMHRRHNAQQAVDCVKIAQHSGFSNITVDLIYGLPALSLEQWENELEQVRKLNVQHLSAYHLGIEPKTLLAKEFAKGSFKIIDEESSRSQYKMLTDWAKENSFIHYEISNFAREGFYSRHNRAYWQQKKYLGVGPSAHSYNLVSRQWNIANNLRYIESLAKQKVPFTLEVLDEKSRFNDYLLTSLRTCWGADLKEIENTFGKNNHDLLLQEAKPFLCGGELIIERNRLRISEGSLIVSDHIISNLLHV
jgi:oxygen-independent coproporphyrinogen III oxidase